MYTIKEGKPVFDSVMAVEGSFKYHPGVDAQPVINLLMVFVEKATGQTYGSSCPARPSIFGPKTLEAFRAFLDSAEEDFGKLIFGTGVLSPFGETQPPNQDVTTQEGLKLPPGLGEKE